MNKSKAFTGTAIATLLVATLAAPVWARAPANLTDTNGDGVISAEEILKTRETHRAAKIVEFDTNGDGELSRAERKAMKKAWKAEMIATHDSDGDGKLSRSEKKAAKKARRAAIQAQLDVNGDGTVSDAERAGLEKVQEEHGHGRKGHKRDRGNK